jgi:hypothetical protein
VTYGPATVDKNLVRGDTPVYRVTVKPPSTGDNPRPEPVDLSGALVRFTVKARPKDSKLQPPTPAVVVKTSDDASEIEILDQSQAETKGQMLIRLRNEDTRWLPAGTYVYDIKIFPAAGGQYTVTMGKIFLKAGSGAAEDLTQP